MSTELGNGLRSVGRFARFHLTDALAECFVQSFTFVVVERFDSRRLR